jgi:hypothetical protein
MARVVNRKFECPSLGCLNYINDAVTFQIQIFTESGKKNPLSLERRSSKVALNPYSSGWAVIFQTFYLSQVDPLGPEKFCSR